jgi:hypothetical protein
MSVRDVVQAAAGQGGDNLYVEDVFSTYLYTGNGSTQTITNGIDLAGEGGLVWQKLRDATTSHALIDTARGGSYYNESNSAFSQDPIGATTFNSNGYSLGSGNGRWNANGYTYVSWTFRKAPKFFDVVTYTGNDVAGRTVAHNLGSVPGCIIVKNITSDARSWEVFHTSLGPTKAMQLDLTTSATTSIDYWNNTSPTSTEFTVGINNTVNTGTHSYVAYLFAHNAGGFGDDNEQNVISCGSFTTDGSGVSTVNLGYEPQWVLLKRSNGAGSWALLDTMRGWDHSASKRLQANVSDAEENYTFAGGSLGVPTATGFTTKGAVIDSNATYIYIAIRRPMKTPESGTEVFNTALINGEVNPYLATSGFPVDLCFYGSRQFSNNEKIINLRSAGGYVSNNTTTPFDVTTNTFGHFDSNTGMRGGTNSQNYAYFQMFKRAPYFYEDTVFVGNGVTTGRSIPHNLKVTPELILFVWSSSAANSNAKYVYHKDLGATRPIGFNNNQPSSGPRTDFFDAPTDTNVVVKEFPNQSGYTVVASCFATLAGISKVGSYSGNGSSQNIDCGFSAGARFIIIKRTDSGANQGDSNSHWYFYDSARGIVSGNDPYSVFNNVYPENAYASNQAQDSNPTDSIDPYASGFAVNQETKLDLNKSGGSYIFLAIA